MTRVLFFLLMILLLTGCSRSVRKSEVIGKYTLDHKKEFSLEIKSDGTYVHTKVDADGKRSEEMGKWEWDDKDTDNPMCLDEFVGFPDEDIGANGQPAFYILHPEYSRGGVRFPVGDPDSPSHYFVGDDSQAH